ncbi:MAG: PD-(D/E)XK nuclease family protein, partial [Acetobacteraceae bacterium]|nr:PD-(D/E)XK nuclease family protein [Acetobacteraceae bacterium]
PRITSFGGLDDAPLAFAGALDVPPAIAPAERLAVLSRMILALPPEAGGVIGADRAWQLARELAALMDEADRSECDLASRLPEAADAAHAEHWQITLRFLEIVTGTWPVWLAEQGLMNPVARQVALLRAQADAWASQGSPEPVWAAGLTAGFPAIAALLRSIAGMPDGCVVLPALDAGCADEIWDALEPGHWQAGLCDLLAAIGTRRECVAIWDGPGTVTTARPAALASSLLPGTALGAWRAPADADLGGVSRLNASDEQEEAIAIAMILRDTLETPGARAALVTPDRALAGRVAAELLRWGVVADDSAGESLADSPPAVMLRLLAQAVAGDLAPVALLGLLKHPLAGLGLAPARCREAARALELPLRGPKPPPGMAGLRLAAGEAQEPFLARLQDALAPLLRHVPGKRTSPREMLQALVEAGERVASTDTDCGSTRLWAHEEGEALSTLLAESLDALRHLPDQLPAVLPSLLDALLEGAVVRSRRALRGRAEAFEHPRVFIWGLLEARLQAAEVVVLGGLAEGVWPAATDPGPWMSREMRGRVGLPSPEERVGQEAHDFVLAACAARRVVLSCPRRRDGAPAVPSRFVVRLEAWLSGQGAALASDPASAWASALDVPERVRPVAPPQPRPPASARPRALPITAIETLLADPYAIYARYVLRLKPLKPLEQDTDRADYGNLVHGALQHFFAGAGVGWPRDAHDQLSRAMQRSLAEALLRPALTEWWAPRLERIAGWVAAEEGTRRAEGLPLAIRTEASGAWTLDVDGPFRLNGRADRIERRADGTISIFDYKTGKVPSAKAVEKGTAPQLPIEAAMAAEGAFGPDVAGPAGELLYWRLTGEAQPGKATALLGSDPARIAAAVVETRQNLGRLLRHFANAETAYRSQPHPGRRPRFPDYAHLARCAEWDLREGEE